MKLEHEQLIAREVEAFSILERIDVGETRHRDALVPSPGGFQYPRTDRRG